MARELYVSLRCEKIKQSMETALHNHNLRASLTKKESNVDGTRSHLNQVILGRRDTVKAINERIAEKIPRKVRDDANRVLEFVISASPEFFYDFEKLGITRKQWDALTPTNDKKYHDKVRYVFNTLDKKKLEQFKEKVKKFCQEEFGENLINCVLHLDEKTPHFHIVVTPIVGNSLTAKKYFTPSTARGWQERFGKICEPLGLSRGCESEKKHQELLDHRLKNAEERGYRKGYRKGYQSALSDSKRFANKAQNFFKPGQLQEKNEEIIHLRKVNRRFRSRLQDAIDDRHRVIQKNQELKRSLRKYEPVPKVEPTKAFNPISKPISAPKLPSTSPMASIPNGDSVASAEISLNVAISDLKQAEAKHGPNSSQVKRARATVQMAREALHRAKEAQNKSKNTKSKI